MLLAEEREAHCMSMQRVNYRIGIRGGTNEVSRRE